jgi:hypothetical protein
LIFRFSPGAGIGPSSCRRGNLGAPAKKLDLTKWSKAR